MPRRARLQVAGYPLHVIQRGHNHGACFSAVDDRTLYLGLLREGARTTGCSVHAYVLMTNHVHLLLTPHDDRSASRLMKFIGERYVPKFNARLARSGTLWGGRFRSSIVETDRYLFTLHRYIELNPVRAGMVRQAREYAWSSHRANAEGLPSMVIEPHSGYMDLGTTAFARQRNYRGLFAQELTDAEVAYIRGRTNAGYPLGSDKFLHDLAGQLKRRVWPGKPGPPFRKAERQLVQQSLTSP